MATGTPIVVSRIQNRRGLQADFNSLYPSGQPGTGPSVLQPGEIALCTDTGNVYIGTTISGVNGYYIEISGSTFSTFTNQIVSTVATGTPPLSVASTTPVANLSIGGNAATATNVAYSGLTGTVPTWNQNTTGNAATATSLYGGITGSLPVQVSANNTIFVSIGGAGSILTSNGATPGWSSAINAVTIGATSPSTGAFTTLSSTGSITSTVSTGTAPLTVTSTTPVANLSIGGNAATATNVAYSGLTGTVPTWNQNTTGNAATATTATNVAYSGLTGTVPTWNQNTTGTATNSSNTLVTTSTTNAAYPVSLSPSATTGQQSLLMSTSLTYNPSTNALVAPSTGSISAGAFIASETITGSLNAGAFSYGTLSYPDVNIFESFTSSVNTYNQSILQNTNSGSAASTDYVVSNNNGTSTTYYGDFGMNSSGFTGSGSLNTPNAVYLTATSGDLVIGTTTNNPIHFVVNGGTTDAFTIGTAGQLSVAGSTGTTGQVLTSNGASAAPSWTTSSGGSFTGGTITGQTTFTYSSGGNVPQVIVGLSGNTVPGIISSASHANIPSALYLSGGAATTSGTGGGVNILGGTTTSGQGGGIVVTGGVGTSSSGNVSLYGGTASAGGAGGIVQMSGGAGTGSGNAGGMVAVAGGVGAGTGAGGPVIFYTASTTSLAERFRILPTGDWSIGTGGTNVGTAGQVLASNGPGTVPSWYNVPYTLAQSGVPVIIPSSGTVAVNGQITMTTALPVAYPNAWVYLPAGAVSGGTAGLYYCVMSSTTVGQIYTNFVAPSATTTTTFTPYIPASPVAAVGVLGAYVTPTASAVTLANITVPGAAIGANGTLRVWELRSGNGNANSKTYKQGLGSTTTFQVVETTSANANYLTAIRNRGVQNAQVQFNYSNARVGSETSGGCNISSVDTSIAQAYTFSAQLAVTTDYIVLEGFTIEVLPHA